MKKFLLAACALASLTFAHTPPARAQSHPSAQPSRPGAQTSATAAESAEARVDKLFAQFDRKDSPGCAVGVVRDGKLVYKRGYGMADLEHDVPLSSQSVFYIGSTSKQFAAAAVALLARQGRLSLDDDIRKHLPELPAYEGTITVRHLLHHTSGLRDGWTLLSLGGRSADEVVTLRDILALAARQKSLNFRPGAEHLYSNTGYWLLAVIVERASGKSLREYADAEIFKPLGMASTVFNDDHTRLIKNRAVGYAPAPSGGFRLATVNNDLVGAGGLWSTVEDLALWDENFYTAKVGGRDFIAQLLTTGSLADGERLDYAFGLAVGEFKGLKLVSHGGALAGYRAELVRFPEQRFSVVCLCNAGNADPTTYALQAAEIYLADDFKKAAAASAGGSAATNGGAQANGDPAAAKVSEQELAALAGVYFNPVTETPRRVYLKEGKLYYWRGPTSESELIPLGANRFAMRGAPGVELTFKPPRAGAPPEIHFASGPGKPSVLEPVRAADYKPEQLSEFAGDYHSEEVDARYTLSAKQGGLVLRTNRGTEVALAPAFTDAFNAPLGLVRFTRDGAGRVTGFTVTSSRARRVRFDRVK